MIIIKKKLKNMSINTILDNQYILTQLGDLIVSNNGNTNIVLGYPSGDTLTLTYDQFLLGQNLAVTTLASSSLAIPHILTSEDVASPTLALNWVSGLLPKPLAEQQFAFTAVELSTGYPAIGVLTLSTNGELSGLLTLTGQSIGGWAEGDSIQIAFPPSLTYADPQY